ncbi:hypothetical protein ASE14_01775 [Agromyces sp. Root81]|uniref:MBL fold metallo-hydrolase n=1 Tax=Agromyces sp. Root81 TaxID=1736601 RepID=UPI0006F57842|nr:MBL fold metallo-hydrolase [Agromyces sp. Root81]KRC62583.1 hypothetical protein ASE14_01775 [Agromyces sp. Root81]
MTVDHKAHPVELAPGVHRIDTPLGDRYASLYILAGDDTALLYDTGVDGTIPDHVLPALDLLGIDATSVTTVVVSHCDVDHFGGVADARAAFANARIVAGPADRAAIEDFDDYLAHRARGLVDDFGWDEDPAVLEWCRSVTRESRLDGTADDGAEVDLGGGRIAVIRAVPGHTRGHVAVDAPWADALLVADAVLGSSVRLADGSPAFPPTYRYVDDYLDTIAALELTDRELLLTAHYPTMRGDRAREFLAESRAFVGRLESLVAVAISRPGGRTLAELVAELNPIAGDWPEHGTQGALAFPVAGHLERLVKSGRAHRAGALGSAAVWAAR